MKPLDSIQQRVLELINPDELTKLTQDLVRIPSVSGAEKEVAMFIANKMKEFGVEVTVNERTPERPNVYGFLRGNETPCLIFNGHIDVVPPGKGWTDDPYSGVLRNNRVYGRGSTDMKGPLASMLVALKALKKAQTRLHGSLMITAVIGEEDDQKGTLQLVDESVKADFAIVGEPTQLKIFIAHKGDLTFEIATTGKAAHASVLHDGVNAIYKMGRIIEAIEEFSSKLEDQKTHPLLGSPTISVGTIEGGTVPAAVPATCKITLDRRTLPFENADTARMELENLIEDLRKKDPSLVASVKLCVDAPPMETAENQPIVRTLREAVRTVTGIEVEVSGAPYCTDGGILTSRANVPTVLFGPGDIREAHRPDESISVNEMVTASKIYALTALALLS